MKKQLGFYFNQNYCVGCQACEIACQVKNNVSEGTRWRKVAATELNREGKIVERFVSAACMHCNEPSCLKVCPVGAYTKRPEDGIVVQDRSKCVGCGYCAEVCPYNAITIDPASKKTEKCDMCVDRISSGQPPACVAGCPLQVLKIGDMEELRRDGAVSGALGFKAKYTNPSICFMPQK